METIAEFELQGTQYRINRLPAMVQTHVLRRMAPIFANLAPALAQYAMMAKPVEGEGPDATKLEEARKGLTSALQPLADALAKMPDSEFEYVMLACLRHTQRLKGDSWGFLYIKDVCMCDDLDAGITIPLMIRVLRATFERFIPGFLTSP